MKIHEHHKWNVSYKEASQIQQHLSKLLSFNNDFDHSAITKLAGADVSYSKGNNRFFASVVIMDVHNWTIIETADAVSHVTFPYIPGLLSFREGPVLLEAFKKIKTSPNAVIFDGQGQAHPRGLGLACHMGLFIDIPSVGCAKTRLVGTYYNPGPRIGDMSDLFLKGKRIGTVLRTKTNVKPVFISPGHRINFEQACQLVLNACHGYRLPEPVRQAHLRVNKLRTNLI